MDLGHLKPARGSSKKRKRLGKGIGSGHGKTSGRGSKGQRARAGSGSRAWSEGGQMPLQRRIPKQGFTNIFRQEYQVVNVETLNRLKKKQIDPEVLFAARIIRRKRIRVKILGDGKMEKACEVKAHAFSESAVHKIEEAGGKAIVI